MDAKSMQMVEDYGKGVIERNEEFLLKKKEKISKQISDSIKQCTFTPHVLTERTPKDLPPNNKNSRDVSERLYSYFEKYEKNKEAYRQQHLND